MIDGTPSLDLFVPDTMTVFKHALSEQKTRRALVVVPTVGDRLGTVGVS